MLTDLHHNQPPDMAQTASDTMRDMSEWMKETPVIDNEDQAREAKVFVDRGRLCIADLEDERDGKVRPLNEQVKKINEYYREPRSLLRKVLDELESRIGNFIRGEETKRQKAAEEARRVAAEAERVARLAEQEERDRLAAAAVGELGVDVHAAVANADEAFREYQKAQRQAAIAEKETKVKIGGGFSRALSLKTKETLVVTDAVAAVMALGKSDVVTEAIIKAARSYRNIFGELPPGVESETERKV